MNKLQPKSLIEVDGPYIHGGGFPAVNGNKKKNKYITNYLFYNFMYLH